MPIGTAIAVARPIISSVPRIALFTPPGSPRKLPFGSVVKKLPLQAPAPFFTRYQMIRTSGTSAISVAVASSPRMTWSLRLRPRVMGTS